MNDDKPASMRTEHVTLKGRGRCAYLWVGIWIEQAFICQLLGSHDSVACMCLFMGLFVVVLRPSNN